MAIKMKTPISLVDKFFSDSLEILEYEISRVLAKLGEECIAKIRDRSYNDSWIDQTGNLRSSIGYAIYSHGIQQLQSAFNVVRKGTDGSSEGKKMIEQLGKKYSQTYALVVVAGMNYAEYVEARENKDVLASTELWAKDVINSRLARAKKEAVDKISKLVL